MVKKLYEYIDMFEDEYSNLQIAIQIKEHDLKLYNDEQGFDILFESLRDIPFELLRYSAEEDIKVWLKYWEEV